MTKTFKLPLAVLPFLLVVGCTDPSKAPAEQAVKTAEQAVASLSDDLKRAAPDQAKVIADAVAGAKTALAKQDYKGALALAGEVPAKVRDLVAAAQAKAAEEAKKLEEAKKAAEEALAKVPAQLDALKSRIAALVKAKKLPKGVTKQMVAQAKTAEAALAEEFTKAKELVKTDAAGAVAKAKEIGEKSAELLKTLKGK